MMGSYAVSAAKDHDTTIDLSKEESSSKDIKDNLELIQREYRVQWIDL